MIDLVVFMAFPPWSVPDRSWGQAEGRVFCQWVPEADGSESELDCEHTHERVSGSGVDTQ